MPIWHVTTLLVSILVVVPILVFSIITVNKPQSRAEGKLAVPVKTVFINGVIQDKDGNLIMAARATIIVGGLKQTIAVDHKGYYIIRDLAPGNYEVQYRAIGFESKTITANIFGDTTQNMILIQE